METDPPAAAVRRSSRCGAAKKNGLSTYATHTNPATIDTP